MKRPNDRICFEWSDGGGGETTQNIRKSRDKYKICLHIKPLKNQKMDGN